MTKQNAIETLKSPGCLMAIVGLALIALGLEAYHYPILSPINNFGSIHIQIGSVSILLSSLITTVGLVILAIQTIRKGARNVLLSQTACFIYAIVMGIGCLYQLGSIDGAKSIMALRICAEFTQLFGLLIMTAWCVRLYRLKREDLLFIVACAFLLASIFQGFLTCLLPMVGTVLCSFAALFSVVFLAFFRSSLNQRQSLSIFGYKHMPVIPIGNRFNLKGYLNSATVAVLFCFVAYGGLMYFGHNTWLNSQTTAFGPLIVQLSGAAGSLCACIAILALLIKNVINDIPYKAIAFTLFALTVCLAASANCQALRPTFSIFLDAGFKIATFLIWMLPLRQVDENHSAAEFVILLVVYHFGAIIAMFSTASSVLSFGFQIICLILLMSELIFVITQSSYGAYQSTGFTPKADIDETITKAQENEAKLAAYNQIIFMMYLSETFDLTQREFEILPYFLNNVANKDIANTLFISQDTVRTHRRNICQKLAVNPNEDLIAKVQTIKETQFPQFLQTLSDSPL